MTARVVWRSVAEEDVIEAAVYVAEDSPSAAARSMDALDETIQALLEMPGSGRLRTFDKPALSGMRSRVVRDFENYLIFYRSTGVGIEVLRVLHGARDTESIFEVEG